MKRYMHFLAIAGLFASAAFAQNIATPVFILKDGEATAAGYSGTEKDIYVDGNAQQSVGWITFQTQGIDVSKIASAKLLLYVKSLSSRGTIEAHALTSDISAPENNVRLSAIVFNPTAAASAVLGTADIEKVIQFDLTALVKSGTFKGVALTSDDGLAVMFDSKEGHLAPVILLTTNVDDVAAKWHSGPGVPAAGLGKSGDFYLNTSSGDVYSKASGAWAVVTNIVGPQGQKGGKGDPGLQGPVGLTGPQGPKGDQGLAGAAGPTGSPGPKGDLGLTGAIGPQGVVGTVGPRGDKGDQGNQGIAGAQGPKGDKGNPGLQGPTGLTGPQGLKGDQGLAGAAGPTGSTGATGANGSFPAGNAPGDLRYWNGTTWIMVPVGQPGQFMQATSSAIPSWSGATYPAITTTAISSITQTTAAGGGTVTSDGGASSTARGVCWNTSANPTIANSKTTDGTGTGAFTSSITGLASNTMYYVRAYATNSAGTAYGNQVSFSTIAGTGFAPDLMISIPGGTFQMGQPNSPDIVHAVTLIAFRMSNTLVTQREYARVMGVNPAMFTGNDLLPMENITWFDAVLYCNKRSTSEQKDTVYAYTSISGPAGNGCLNLENVAIDYAKNGYRLPTEAEWEYACRAGTTTDFFWGGSYPPRTTQDTLDIDMHAVWYHNAGIQTLPVGSKLPNAWDLYDIVGNLWEWANDWDAPYSPDPQIDPVGPATGASRIVRGGTWSVYDDDRHLRSGARNGGYHPYDRGYLTGFRIVQR